MSNRARDPGLPARVRDLEELVRRLGTRIPLTDAVGDWQDLVPYLGAAAFIGLGATDWITHSAGLGLDEAAPRFYVDRDRVHFAGEIKYDASTVTAEHRFPFRMPVGYRPRFAGEMIVFAHQSYTSSATRGMFWLGRLVPSGETGEGLFAIDQNFPASSPDFGYPPAGTALLLDGLSYRLSQ